MEIWRTYGPKYVQLQSSRDPQELDMYCTAVNCFLVQYSIEQQSMYCTEEQQSAVQCSEEQCSVV